MPTRLTYLVIIVLAVLVLFTLDRVHVRDISYYQRQMLSHASRTLTAQFRAFFEERLQAMACTRMALESSPAAENERLFPAAARRRFSRLPGVESAAYLDENASVLTHWSRTETGADERTDVFHAPRTVRETAERAMASGNTILSEVILFPDRDFGIIAAEPVKGAGDPAPRAIAVEFRIWPVAQHMFHLDVLSNFSVLLEDPYGTLLPSDPTAGQYDGPEQTTRFTPVDGGPWTVHVRPTGMSSSLHGFSRIGLWGLGCALILSFLLLYFLLAEKNVELEKHNRLIAEQVRSTREANERLLRANRALDDFSRAVSHDLKEPLRGIEGLSRLLLAEHGDTLDETGREYLASIRASGKRMQRLVGDLLRLSRSTRRHYPHVLVDFNDLVREVLETLQYSIEQKGAAIEVQPGLPSVSSDRVRMAELMQNLVSNAVKFNSNPRPVVKIAHEEKESEHCFCVSDNGMGIPEEQRKRVFEVFQRLHGDDIEEGTGVGLAICKDIVERHDGRIWVEEADGGGARFCFTLSKHPPPLDFETETTVEAPSAN